jgi:aminoglycoside 3-N-acetyltransferase
MPGEPSSKLYEKCDLVRQLHDLGLAVGDTVLVRVDFGKLGRLRKPGDQTLMESILEVVGRGGTLLALTHSPTQMLFRRDSSYVYHPATAPCLTGRFAEAVLHWEGACRSLHPTCSMTGLGPGAWDILRHHDHRSTCFGPMKSLMASGGKMLLIGCTASSPGFSTVHYVYEELGLATKSLLRGMLGCYYFNRDRVRWFRQRDVPGCSMGFHRFYSLYRKHAFLSAGLVGRAESFLIKASDAFQVERAAVLEDARISLCDDPHCFSCRGTKLFNLSDMPRYYWTHAPRKLLKRLRRAG